MEAYPPQDGQIYAVDFLLIEQSIKNMLYPAARERGMPKLGMQPIRRQELVVAAVEAIHDRGLNGVTMGTRREGRRFARAGASLFRLQGRTAVGHHAASPRRVRISPPAAGLPPRGIRVPASMQPRGVFCARAVLAGCHVRLARLLHAVHPRQGRRAPCSPSIRSA